MLQHPIASHEVLVLDRELILDDGADIGLGKRQLFRHDLDAPGLDDHFLEGRGSEIDYTAVMTDRARLKIEELGFGITSDLGVGVALAVLIQYLDAVVEELRVVLVVNLIGIVELYRRRACRKRTGIGVK